MRDGSLSSRRCILYTKYKGIHAYHESHVFILTSPYYFASKPFLILSKMQQRKVTYERFKTFIATMYHVHTKYKVIYVFDKGHVFILFIYVFIYLLTYCIYFNFFLRFYIRSHFLFFIMCQQEEAGVHVRDESFSLRPSIPSYKYKDIRAFHQSHVFILNSFYDLEPEFVYDSA